MANVGWFECGYLMELTINNKPIEIKILDFLCKSRADKIIIIKALFPNAIGCRPITPTKGR